MESNLSHYFTPVDNPKTAEYYHLQAVEFEYRVLRLLAFALMLLFSWEQWGNHSGERVIQTLTAGVLFVIASVKQAYYQEQLYHITPEDSLLLEESQPPDAIGDHLSLRGKVAFDWDKIRYKLRN